MCKACLNIYDKFLFGSINPDEEIYFIFYEEAMPAYSRNYLKHLRQKYKSCKLVFCFTNPAVDMHSYLIKKWKDIKDLYDLGITFNKSDADRLKILFCDYWPCLLPELDFEPDKSSDIFFVGQAKDRLQKILKVYEHCRALGLKCDFYVTGVPREEMQYPDDINYNELVTYRWLTYEEILQHVINTKCVLEILPFDQHYSSLRVNEALWYGKKLLTTNRHAEYEWFYNPERVKIFSDVSEISADFITAKIPKQF